MYYHHKPQNNHRKIIEQYASDQELYKIIEQEIRTIKSQNKPLPRHVN